MRVSYEWLSEYVDLSGYSAEELAEKLTRSGVEVELVERRNQGASGIIAGYVKACERHPDADKLRVCTVDIGEKEDLQIVCGADNIAAGQTVPVAVVGAVLPGNFNIKKAKLRGVESHGMICSAKEIGLNERLLPKELQEGIYILPEAVALGTDMIELLGLNDDVLELELTPNRADCLSMIGVAYEVAAILERQLHLPEPDKELQEMAQHTSDQIKVTIESDDCRHYATRILEEVQIGPAPQWIQNRLIAAHIRPINNVVDITNYVMLEYGQPLHAFDLDELTGGQMMIRQATEGEVLQTLDGEKRTLDPSMLVIADAEKPVALAGVMGGADSEVTGKTTRIMLESANFTGATVRLTSKTVGLRSESSLRFEKEADPAVVLPALHRAATLIAQYAGGQVSRGVAEDRRVQDEPVVLPIRLEQINQYLGTNLALNEVTHLFDRLRFVHETDQTTESLIVHVPTRRGDIFRDVDLIEEVARLYGYDRIPTTPLLGQTTPGHLTAEQTLRRKTRHWLLGQGIHESIHYAFTDPKNQSIVGAYFDQARPVMLSMPMSEERSMLRTSLIPHLLEAATYNVHRGEHDLATFELGKVFITDQQQLTSLPEERMMLSILMMGSVTPMHWLEKPRQVDFYDLKGMLDALFNYLGVQVTYEPVQIDGFHPGRTAEVSLLASDGTKKRIGRLGQIHPEIQQRYDLEDTYMSELEWAPIVEYSSVDVTYEQLLKYPASTRDIAVVLDEEIRGADMLNMLRQEGGSLLEAVDLFDIYRGENIGHDKKSMAFSLRYRDQERTLTDEEVSKLHDHLLQCLQTQFKAELRS